jgi:hypothetical protein
MRFTIVATIAALNLLANCTSGGHQEIALTSTPQGKPTREEVLSRKYVGQRVSEIELEFGPPFRRFEMGADEAAVQWQKVAIAGAQMCLLTAVVTKSKTAPPPEWRVNRLTAVGYMC